MPKGDLYPKLLKFTSGPVSVLKVQSETAEVVDDLVQRVYDLEVENKTAEAASGASVTALVFTNGFLGYMNVNASGVFLETFE